VIPDDEAGAAGRRVRRGLVGLAILAIAVGWVVLRRERDGAAGEGRGPEQMVSLVAPRGDLDAPPALFAWKPVAGAVRYRVRIADADTVWPLFVRTTDQPSLVLDPGEIPALVPGRMHEWDVEAYDAGGSLVASGGTQFRVRPDE
jgi:hypothetical protein